MKKISITAFLFLLLFSCHNGSQSNSSETNEIKTSDVPIINHSWVKTFPHDTTMFTEGFVFHDGKLFESSGAGLGTKPYTKSNIGISNLETGKFDEKIVIDKSKYFGEGIVFLDNKLYQLTWLNHIGFIYDAKTFKQTGTFKYSTKGWALTTDGKYILMDDGTDKIYYLNPSNMKPVKALSVTRDNMPQDNLNEFEFIKGYLYANIWQTNEIVKIDTATGKIIGKIDLSSIVYEAKTRHPAADVLNGIAYDSVSDKIYITGKLWQNIYQINFPH